jgi:hypothetical protein
LAIQLSLIAFVGLFFVITTIVYNELPEWQALIAQATSIVMPREVAFAVLIYAGIRSLGLGLCTRPGGVLRCGLIGTCLTIEIIAFYSFFRLRPGHPFLRTREVAYLSERATSNYRIMELLSFSGRSENDLETDSWSMWPLHMNAQAWWPKLLSANVYSSLMPASYWAVIHAMLETNVNWRGGNQDAATERADAPLLPLLGVRWVISRHELEPGPYKLVNRGVAYYVYELNDPLPRAFVVTRAIEAPVGVIEEILSDIEVSRAPSDILRRAVLLSTPETENRTIHERAAAIIDDWTNSPATDAFVPARVIRDSGNTIALEATLSKPGWLVLSDNDYPGWTARVNGRPARIRRANLFARAVPLLEGRSTIEFEYRPQSFRTGVFVSAGALGLVLFGLVWAWRPHWRPKRLTFTKR